MGRRGPKPKTAEELRIIGSHAPKQPKGSVPPVGKPICPRSLSLEAKRQWKRIVEPLIGQGLLGQADTHALARYCQLQARLEECETKMATEGLVVMYTSGNVGKSPWVTIATETARLLMQLEKELGLTPYSRRSLTPAKPEQSEEPAAKYFG